MNGLTQQYRWLPLIDWAACTGCGDCALRCPTGAIGLCDGKAVIVDPQACTYTASCEAACPVAAIALPYQVVLDVPGDSQGSGHRREK